MNRAGRYAPLWRRRLAAGVITGLVVASTASGVTFAQDEDVEAAAAQAAIDQDAGALGVLGAIDQARADQEAAAIAAQEAAAQEAAAQEAAAAEPVAAEAPAEEVVAAQEVPAEAAPVDAAVEAAPPAPEPSLVERAAADALPEGIDAGALFAPEVAPVEAAAPAPVPAAPEVAAPVAADEASSDATGDSARAGNGGNAGANGDGGRVSSEQPVPVGQRVAAEQPAGGRERGGVVGLRNRLVGVETEPTGGLAVGNGGTGSASADGGYILIDEITTGNNSGNTINACGVGSGSIDGGSVVNESTFNMEIGGGTALGIAPGGDLNSAGPTRDGVTGGIITNGNGGVALGSADGGWIVINTLDTGGNSGNSINVGCEDGGGYAGDGTVSIDGGNVTNTSTFNISATGGTAIADGSGGDENAGTATATGGAAADEGRRRRGVVALRNELLGIGGDPVGGILSVGNGGTARATADGGIVIIDSINTGGNTGNTINVGSTAGGGGGGGKPSAGNSCLPSDLSIYGGDVVYTNTFDISADGGTAIADGSGGDGNIGFGDATGVLALGNGGTADATANGGLIQIENINTGNNSGNTIDVAEVGCAQLAAPVAPKPGAPVAKPIKPGAAMAKPEKAAKPGAAAPDKKAGNVRAAAPKTVQAAKVRATKATKATMATKAGSTRTARGGAGAVRSLPSTGTGTGSALIAGRSGEALALLAALTLPVLVIGGRRRWATQRSGR